MTLGTLVLASLLVGCGGTTTAPATNSTDDSKAGPRRKEMADFMKNQKPAGNSR